MSDIGAQAAAAVIARYRHLGTLEVAARLREEAKAMAARANLELVGTIYEDEAVRDAPGRAIRALRETANLLDEWCERELDLEELVEARTRLRKAADDLEVES